ncbi:TSUP family transporter [Microvirga tunisiensis]|uniref:Probable membrane transporter protein n=1 Tax=Pannonibacter tanglangensis TaxID=2750084 RepID=A0A7X5JAU0_9HYPH|nr:sulfite exporter TauE/SafE family protein [Pannonibacter sp. XCT-53]NBN79755.1 TSUP family transporter [Pannonibacter sp. XCT-53]
MLPLSDPLFYAAAVPAVVLAGLSKGGFGGSIGMLAVPLMALVIPPVQAAGILLPILVVMDVVGLLAYRGVYDRRALVLLLPAGIAGVGVGWATASLVNDAQVTLLVGVLCLVFVAERFVPKRAAGPDADAGGQGRGHRPLAGAFWGAMSGFTSFVSHTGGPPFQLYMVPLSLAPALFAGTAVIFFAAINAVKLVPYFFLGQFDARNLATAAVLLPLAPLSTLAGVWLVKRIEPRLFYALVYVAMAVIGVKLVHDSARQLFG